MTPNTHGVNLKTMAAHGLFELVRDAAVELIARECVMRKTTVEEVVDAQMAFASEALSAYFRMRGQSYMMRKP